MKRYAYQIKELPTFQEDVDVCENDYPCDVKSKKENAEPALENDHDSMYANWEKLVSPVL